MQTASISSKDFDKFEELLVQLAKDFIPVSGLKNANMYAAAILQLQRRLRASHRYGKALVVLSQSEVEVLAHMVSAGSYDMSFINSS